MNKRQKKKHDKKLYHAIVELNRMVAEDIGESTDFVNDKEAMMIVFNHVKSNPNFVRLILMDYKRFISPKFKLK